MVVDQTSQLRADSVTHVEEHHTLPSYRDSISQSMKSQRVSYFPTCLLASADH